MSRSARHHAQGAVRQQRSVPRTRTGHDNGTKEVTASRLEISEEENITHRTMFPSSRLSNRSCGPS